tara:strand:- start:319 stop:966 length:648 start_codon:yes stop_codon:yes gene_type:complete
MTLQLNDLCKKYNSDKCNEFHTYNGNTYCDIYQRYFDKIRFDVKKFIEIGVRDGASLRMWKEYFPNATIYGIDIDPRCETMSEERINIFIGDQNNLEFLYSVKEQIGEYDILVDDGSHITRHQIQSYNILYPNLKSKGYYVIEDMRCSYEEKINHHDLRDIWPGMKFNDTNDDLKNYRNEFRDFVENKIKSMDMCEKQNLLGIHNYSNMVVFENI